MRRRSPSWAPRDPRHDPRRRRQALGVQMSADMMKLSAADLFEGVEGIIGATEFMEMSEGAQIIFI